MQIEWRRAISEDPLTGLDAPILELRSIGGWFAIQALQTFLTPQGQVHWYRALKKDTAAHPDNDVLLTRTPTQLALTILPQVLPNPPVQFKRENSAVESNRQVKVWQDWIAAHKDELSKLRPTGEGVDFSPNACKNGKPPNPR